MQFCKDPQMANKYIKRCTVSLAMREIQIKNDDEKKIKN